MSAFRFTGASGNELPPPPPNSESNPDWIEPADGEIVEVWMTAEGAKKAVYKARTKQVEWSPFRFGELHGYE